MEVRFIGQGYNPAIGSSVAQELIGAFANRHFTSFKCLVAFASVSGVSAITPHIRGSHIRNHRIIVGIDQKGTSKEALEELLTWGVDVFIYYTRQNIIFHPKVYLFEGDERALIIVGSNNFTQRGLVENIEGSLLLDINKTTDGRGILDDIERYFSPMISNADQNLKPISAELIERLVASRKVPTEAQRRGLYAKERNVDQAEAESLNDLFSTIPIQRRPEGFNPTRRSVARGEGVETEPDEIIDNNIETVGPAILVGDEETWTFGANDNILIAEIGGPARWQQANFPKTVFQNFFGAEAGNNNYTITLRHVLPGGEIQEIEVRQAVSVKSQNYRFELGASAGLDYPEEDRPIGIFIRLGNQRFLYTLAMPDADYYDEINDFLEEHYEGPARQLKRVNTTANQLQDSCPNLPFWEI